MPGVEASTGSLGHGIGLAVGMALACRSRQRRAGSYVLIGDGEANEGTVWEAIMVATNLKLGEPDRLYDDNQSQIRWLQIPDPAENVSRLRLRGDRGRRPRRATL